MDSITIGQRIKNLREASGLSAYRVAKDSKVPQSLLSVIESGKKDPTDETLSKLAPVLGVPFEELKAWADADRIGPESVERISREWIDRRLAEIPGEADAFSEQVRKALAAGDKEEMDRLEAEALRLQAETIRLCELKSRLPVEEVCPPPEKPTPSGEIEIPKNLPEPPDAMEMEIIHRIGASDFGDFDPRRDGQFWYLPKAKRLRWLRHLEDLWLEEQEDLKKRGGQ